MFRKSTYTQESAQATRLRGVPGSNPGTDRLDIASNSGNDKSSSKQSKRQKKQKDSRFHKVSKGETLSAIARKHGTSVKALCAKNGIKQNATLRLGQIIKY